MTFSISIQWNCNATDPCPAITAKYKSLLHNYIQEKRGKGPEEWEREEEVEGMGEEVKKKVYSKDLRNVF